MTLRGALAGTDLAGDFCCELVLGFFEFVVALQSQAEFRRRAEVAREAERGVCCDCAITFYDFRDPVGGHAQIHRESMDADAGWNDEVFA